MWPSNMNTLIFRHNTATITEEECLKYIEKHDTDSKTDDHIINAIKVQRFDLSWMFRDGKNFTDLVVVLNDSDRKEIFATNFVKFLIDQFWDTYQGNLIRYMFVPFCCYATFSISFMYFSIKRVVEPIEDAYPAVTYTIAGIVTLLFWAYQVYLDIR